MTDDDTMRAMKLLQDIRDALGTKETGEALIEVARNAHKAEQELAAVKAELEELKDQECW